MENSEYYHALAERIVVRGARVGEFDSFASYRDGKDIEDLREILQTSTLDGTPSLAEKLYGILEIDTRNFDRQSDNI